MPVSGFDRGSAALEARTRVAFAAPKPNVPNVADVHTFAQLTTLKLLSVADDY
jgi:hypothetical protein